jgi:hypothetical protein
LHHHLPDSFKPQTLLLLMLLILIVDNVFMEDTFSATGALKTKLSLHGPLLLELHPLPDSSNAARIQHHAHLMTIPIGLVQMPLLIEFIQNSFAHT